MSKIRVLVIEDSLTVRNRLREVLERDARFEVVGEAADGARAIELCLSLRPDVITMDLVLSGTNGLVATEYIMAHCPTPILIVSAADNRGELVFELRGATQRQFALYRIMRGTAEKLFVTGGSEIGTLASE